MLLSKNLGGRYFELVRRWSFTLGKQHISKYCGSAVLLLDTGANTGTGTSLIKTSTSSLGLKSPGNKVVLSCVLFSYHDADDAETVVDIQKSVVYRFNYNETCG